MNAARRFLKEVLASSGRRTDLERNAFMAAAVALIPSDVFKNRKGRAVMRLLDVNYQVVKMAADMRAQLEDGSRKWKLLKTAPHADRNDWSIINKWLHSEEASCEDNSRKDLVRVNLRVDEGGGQVNYEFHRARILSGSKDELREKFERSAEFVAMRQAYAKKKHQIRRKRAVVLAKQAAAERLLRGEVSHVCSRSPECIFS